MVVVLMDTRHHKTRDFEYVGRKLIQPIDTGKEILFAEFEATGDKLCGDWIFIQKRGPEIPDAWWSR